MTSCVHQMEGRRGAGGVEQELEKGWLRGLEGLLFLSPRPSGPTTVPSQPPLATQTTLSIVVTFVESCPLQGI